jgi:hypothetical protein
MTNDNEDIAASKDGQHQVNFTAQDMLAAIGFEAQRLAAGVAQHAAGYPFPDPMEIKKIIDRMGHLNKTLIMFGGILGQSETSGFNVGANSGMGAELSN